MKQFNTLFVILALVLVSTIGQVNGQEGIVDTKAESIEDWETGDFSQFEWQLTGDADWYITDVDPYEGTYSARSGDINDGQSTGIMLEYNVYDEDTLSFYYKVSSENNWDYLRFYVDGIEMGEWSGNIPWSMAQYVIPVGVHTFEWVYEKDFSVSTGEDCAWVDLITFPPEEIQANFIADTTVICLTDVVFFTDLSIGPVTEWYWVFEGAVPGTSTDQNPVVAYNQVGAWDVFLEVSDGIETAVHYMPAYITVSVTPSAANTPVGITNLCASWGNTTYNTVAMGGDVFSYDWQLDPTEAGTISGNGGTNVTVLWDPDFLGTVGLSVAGINYCGIGTYSEPLMITIYLPDVSLTVPAYVALPEPAFQLTGGTPSGGEYSGPGVSNGWFDPVAAGLGQHTITYTYTDPNLCTNSDSAIITVTEFIGIDEKQGGKSLSVFPNPSDGSFVVQLNNGFGGNFSIEVYNMVNKLVHKEENVVFSPGYQKTIHLSQLTNGIYFMKVSGQDKEYTRKVVIRK